MRSREIFDALPESWGAIRDVAYTAFDLRSTRRAAQSGEVTRTKQLAPRSEHATDLASADEPPVVARLVVEIRSDGDRTVARGSLEDAQLGERTSLEVKGATPFQLVLSLVKALFHVPAFASSVARALLAGRMKDTAQNQGVRDHAPARPPRRRRGHGEPPHRRVDIVRGRRKTGRR